MMVLDGLSVFLNGFTVTYPLPSPNLPETDPRFIKDTHIDNDAKQTKVPSCSLSMAQSKHLWGNYGSFICCLFFLKVSYTISLGEARR